MDEASQQWSQADEIGLLDILVTLAENIKLLVLGPLVIGLLALGVSFVWPKTYESVAVLQAGPAVASLITTSSVIDPVSQALGMRENATLEQARENLRRRIKTHIGRNDKLLTLTISGDTPAQAQAAAKALLKFANEQSRPRGNARARLEKELVEAQIRLKLAQRAAAQSLAELPNDVPKLATVQKSESLDMLAGVSVRLLDASATAQKRISELEAELEGQTDAQIVQEPTLPERPASPQKARVTLTAALGAAFVFLLYVFAHRALARVSDPDSLNKILRLRTLLGLRN